MISGLLPRRGQRRHPYPLDAAGVHPAQQVHGGDRRLGLRGPAVGGVQLRAAALLRADQRAGGPVPQGRPPAGLPGEHAQVHLQADDAVLEPQAGLPALLQDPAAGAGDHRGGDCPHSETSAFTAEHAAVTKIVCLDRGDTSDMEEDTGGE